ncbi:MAG: GNAT family N-acetyltransferase [Deltaproteobacteria bacterium]|nr:GNAT family N-acetyltransferase [Deltaproteobacteria bacterium]MBW2076669.1 GNAT family N-acetyltransferase [Deltaproteobacteria bacterium]
MREHRSKIRINRGYIPGSIGRIIEIHGAYYGEHWGFGSFFEAKVASELAEFIARYDDKRDGLWTASLGGRIEGSIAIDGIHAEGKGAHLRWFIVSPSLHGRGIGSRLITEATRFCRNRGYRSIYLWTFEGLEPAKHLYEKTGFTLREQRRGTMWGTEVKEQRFELSLE